MNDPLYCSNPILNRNLSYDEVKIIVDKPKSVIKSRWFRSKPL